MVMLAILGVFFVQLRLLPGCWWLGQNVKGHHPFGTTLHQHLDQSLPHEAAAAGHAAAQRDGPQTARHIWVNDTRDENPRKSDKGSSNIISHHQMSSNIIKHNQISKIVKQTSVDGATESDRNELQTKQYRVTMGDHR